MVHTISTWLLVAGFFGAGVVNALGAAGTRADFARWGYPRWWAPVTGLLEIAAAALIALPATRAAGLALGALVIAGALATLLRHREFGHLAPPGVFALALALTRVAA